MRKNIVGIEAQNAVKGISCKLRTLAESLSGTRSLSFPSRDQERPTRTKRARDA